jgi:hypothetical protein
MRRMSAKEEPRNLIPLVIVIVVVASDAFVYDLSSDTADLCSMSDLDNPFAHLRLDRP